LQRIQCCVEVGPKTLAENKASLHRAGLRRVVEKQEGTSNADVHEEQNVDVETKHILHQRLGGKKNRAGISNSLVSLAPMNIGCSHPLPALDADFYVSF
jgi:hypothetical protein